MSRECSWCGRKFGFFSVLFGFYRRHTIKCRNEHFQREIDKREKANIVAAKIVADKISAMEGRSRDPFRKSAFPVGGYHKPVGRAAPEKVSVVSSYSRDSHILQEDGDSFDPVDAMAVGALAGAAVDLAFPEPAYSGGGGDFGGGGASGSWEEDKSPSYESSSSSSYENSSSSSYDSGSSCDSGSSYESSDSSSYQ